MVSKTTLQSRASTVPPSTTSDQLSQTMVSPPSIAPSPSDLSNPTNQLNQKSDTRTPDMYSLYTTSGIQFDSTFKKMVAPSSQLTSDFRAVVSQTPLDSPVRLTDDPIAVKDISPVSQAADIMTSTMTPAHLEPYSATMTSGQSETRAPTVASKYPQTTPSPATTGKQLTWYHFNVWMWGTLNRMFSWSPWHHLRCLDWSPGKLIRPDYVIYIIQYSFCIIHPQ